MSAGTLVVRLGQALKSKLIPLGLCQAEQPDAKIWAQPLASCRLLSGSVCCLIQQFVSQREVAEESVHFYFQGKRYDAILRGP